MEIDEWKKWGQSGHPALIIGGPCSAESPDQILATAKHLLDNGVHIMRAGVWKPRTRPNSFEGKGHEALRWLAEVKKQTAIKVAIEVASPQHLEAALSYGVDIVWLGARTTVNPFLVQDIASSLKGVKIPVLVKNPINPDIALWQGALERISNAGVTQLAAVHRGFSNYQKSKFRNSPAWQIPIQLKSNFPTLPLICDPSHIAGNRNLIGEISQKALDLGYDGLMVETHPSPDAALSDAEQQLSLDQFSELLQQLRFSERHSNDALFISQLEDLREKIDYLDEELIEILALRKELIERIGDYKKENNVTVFQLERWNEIRNSRPEWGSTKGLSPEFIHSIYRTIHDESIRVQTEIMNKQAENKK